MKERILEIQNGVIGKGFLGCYLDRATNCLSRIVIENGRINKEDIKESPHLHEMLAGNFRNELGYNITNLKTNDIIEESGGYFRGYARIVKKTINKLIIQPIKASDILGGAERTIDIFNVKDIIQVK